MKKNSEMALITEGSVLDDAGNLITTTYIDLRDEGERTAIPALARGCRREHALEDGETVLISKPARFREEAIELDQPSGGGDLQVALRGRLWARGLGRGGVAGDEAESLRPGAGAVASQYAPDAVVGEADASPAGAPRLGSGARRSEAGMTQCEGDDELLDDRAGGVGEARVSALPGPEHLATEATSGVMGLHLSLLELRVTLRRLDVVEDGVLRNRHVLIADASPDHHGVDAGPVDGDHV